MTAQITQSAEPLTGRIIGHQDAGPVTAEETGGPTWFQRCLTRTGRVARGAWSSPKAIYDWRMATEYDRAVHLAEESGNVQAIGAIRKEQDRVQSERRARLSRFGLEVGCIAVPIAWGGWVWFTLTATVVLLGSLGLLARKAMHGKVPMRCAEVFGISLLLEVIEGAALDVHPSPIVMDPLSAPVVLLLPVGIWAVATILPALLNDGKIKAAEIATLSALGVPLGVVADLVYVGWHVQGLSWAWSPTYLLPPAVAALPTLIWGGVWAWKAMADDGTIADDLRHGEGTAELMADPDADAGPVSPARAMMATGRLGKDDRPVLLQPGVVAENGGAIWTATVDTRGPSATVFIEPKAHAELASRMRLSTRRLVLTVDEDRGSWLHMIGIVGKPWASTSSPVLDLRPVDLWDGIDFGRTISGERVVYRVADRNSLFGGESGAGKSTALVNVWAPFALSVDSPIWVVDGGLVDTKPLADFGLTRAWTTELPEALKILREIIDEINRRQALLASTRNPDGSTKRKVDPEFFAEHGLSFGLGVFDEIATFTQRKGKEAADFSDLLREGVQRSRKVGLHLLLATQSPSVEAIDGDARDSIPVRWCGRARSVDLGNKVLGKGAAGRGLSPLTLPDDDDTRGVGWYSAPGSEVQVRPHGWSDSDIAKLCRGAAELRRGTKVETAADDDRALATQIAELIRERGVDVSAGRVMLARDVATVLEMDQMELRSALGRVGVGTQKVSRPDDSDAHGRMHYVLADLPAARAAR